MSNYTKSTNFATKDNLTPGDPLKVVRGTEIDTEFNNIATAVATKTDNSAAAITGGSIAGITDLAVADGGTGASTATAALNNLLPSQTGNANKYLQTDGTNATWDAVSLSTADITGTLPVANGGTGVTSSTGTGSVVLSNSPTLVTPALGTPASGTATNLTGLPISTGVSGLGTGVATFLGTPSSANLASAVTDETGTGALVFANTPTLVAPILGTPTSGNFSSGSFTWPTFNQNTTGTAAGLSATLAIASGGTGATTAGGALTSLGAYAASNPSGYTTNTGTVTSVGGTGTVNGLTLTGTVTTSGNLTLGGTLSGVSLTSQVSGTLPTANGGTNLTSFTSGGVVYASSTSALATGSALTFDGTKLSLGATSAVNNLLTLAAPSTTYTPQVAFQNTTNSQAEAFIGSGSNANNIWVTAGAEPTGDPDGSNWATARSTVAAIYRQRNANHIWFTNTGLTASTTFTPTEAMRLTSTGLGIGTSSPSQKLEVSGTILAKTTSTPAIIARSTSTGMKVFYDDGRTEFTAVNYDGISTVGAQDLFITSGQKATFGVNSNSSIIYPLEITTAGVLSIPYGQIKFPATQSASSDANTLDDYEEGTWTPVLTGDAGGTAMTYSVQLGKYTKIGNVVTADVSIILSNRGTIIGNAIVTGLPFTGNANYNSSITWGYWDSLATSWASVGGWLNSGTTIYLGGQKTSGTVISVFANGDFNNTSRFNVQVIYTLS